MKCIKTITLIFSIILSVGLLSCQMSATPSSSSEIQVSDILLEKTSYVIEVGSTESISCKIVPENATNKTIAWKSLNSSIVTVNKGTIKGIAKGDTKISITCGKIEKEIEVSVVNKKIRVSSFTVSPESKSIVVGDEFSVVTTITPENATDKTITWKSDNTEIATVDSGKIKGVSAGTANITATCDGIEKTICVTVTKQKVLVSGFELTPSSVTIGLGDEFEIATSITPENATDKTIIWESENEDCVSVSEGVITGVGIGSTNINATCGGIRQTVSVVVKESVIPVTSISLSKSEVYLNKNQTVTIVASVLPENATDKTISWKSSDSNVVTVQDGIISAKEYGNAIITATSGNCSAEVAVTVCIPVESINLSEESLTMNIGDSRTITAIIYPSDSTDKTIVWASSNESVATVTNGIIRAIAGGNTTITATCGGVSNSCLVSVIVPVTSLTLSETLISIVQGSTYKIKSSIDPSNATNKTVTWVSSNESVATVVNGVITAISEGSARITATADGKEAYVNVTVTNNSGLIPVSSLLLSQTDVSIKIGESQTVIATVNPTNADDATVTWISANENIACVSYGIITGKAVGSTTITANAGGISKTISVSVIENSIPIVNLTISPNIYNLVVGGSKTVVPNILPAIATDRTITWKSSDNSIATVSASGVVTAKSSGYVTITATAKSGVSADAVFLISDPGFTVSLPENAHFTNEDFITLTYSKKGSIYTFKASSTKQCGYIAFYVNGEQKIDVNTTGTKYEEYSVDISTLTKKYLSVFAFGMYDAGNDSDGIINDVITCKNQITIDLTKEN